ncbi:MAG: hypothetical protein M3N50_02075 [Pseudomonadota bacterium]|nr:hypothetical protein [Pseudomonadota bacterium]
MDLHVYRSSMEFSARERVATDVDGNPPPLRPWAKRVLEKRLSEAEKGKIFANNAARCLPQGIPYMLFAAVDGPIQILENPGQVTVLATEMSEHWLIYLNTDHLKPFYPNYHGDSVGHWEGGTLVVDTVGLSGNKTTIDQVGTPHTDALHVITRIKRIDRDNLEVRVLLDDPKTFTHPWERKVMYKRAAPAMRIDEYVCDSNRNAPDAHGFQGFK